jgi:hypothetical protein
MADYETVASVTAARTANENVAGDKSITPSAAVISGGGADAANYSITYATGSFTITARPITVTANGATKVYGEVDPTITSYVTGTMAANETVSVYAVRTDGENVAGDKVITLSAAFITGGGADAANYNITYVAGSFTITARPITITANGATKVYGDADPTLTAFTITAGTMAAGETVSVYAARTDGENVAGDKSITLNNAFINGTFAPADNYAITYVAGSFTITPKAITVTADLKTSTYGDADPALTYSITTGGALVTGDAFTGTLSRSAGGAGQRTITAGTLSAGANYTLTFVNSYLWISPRSITVTSNSATKVYGDADPTLTDFTVTGTMADYETVASVTAARTAGENVAGDKSITPSVAIISGGGADAANYSITYATGSFTITAKAITVTAAAKSKTYGSDDPALTYSITTGGALVGNDAFTGGLSRAVGENAGAIPNAGIYIIVQNDLALSANYTLSYVGDYLSITPRIIIVRTQVVEKTYGDIDPELTYTSNFPDVQVGTDADPIVGALSRTSGEDVGLYWTAQNTVGSESSNYLITFLSSYLIIGPKTVSVNYATAARDYDGSVVVALGEATLTGVVGEDDLSISGATGSTANKSVGSNKEVTVTGGTLAGSDVGNYVLGSSTATAIDITAITVSVNYATATRVYNGTNVLALGTATFTGVVVGDAVTISGATGSTADESVGTDKTVTVTGGSLGGGDAGNYLLDTSTATAINITAIPAAPAPVSVSSGPAPMVSQTALGVVPAATTVQLTKTTTLSTTGGSGSGAITYATSTPTICSVTSAGVVSAVAVGTCSLTATKASDGSSYLAATSVAVTIAISNSEALAAAEKVIADKAAADKVIADKAAADKVIADKAAADKAAADAAASEGGGGTASDVSVLNSIKYSISGKTKTITLDLADKYAGQKVDITIKTTVLVKGKITTNYLKVSSVKLNSTGKAVVKTTVAIKAGNSIQVKLGGITIKSVTVK